MSGDLTINFSRREFACPCCGKDDISLSLVYKLQGARIISEVPFIITSGVRCKKHNDELVKKRKAVYSSSHLKGLAADILADTSEKRFKIIRALLLAGFERIGVGKDFIHCDIDESKPKGIIWTYYKD